MNLIDRFQYKTLEKVTYASGARHYICPETGSKLPSVTTILDKTAGEKTALLEWKKRVGEVKAAQAQKEGLGIGTFMHTHLEKYVMNQPRPGGNNPMRVMCERMADQIIERGLVHVNEVYGSEVQLYCPQMFAGTTDLVGLYKNQPAIMDFKTAKKIRKRDMIDDYFHQLAAYGMAHNELFNTQIRTGVIFMVSRTYEFETFIIEGAEFKGYEDKFLDRLETFLGHAS
jgi:hypothetical protein